MAPSDNRRLVALGPDGVPRWERPLPEVAIGNPLFLVDGTTIVPCDGGWVVAFDALGTARWTNRGNYLLRAGAAIGADGLIYLPTSRELLLVNPETGNPTRRITPSSLTALAIGPDGTMAYSPQARLIHLYLPDHPLRVLNLPGTAVGAVAFAANSELYVPVGPQLLAFSPTNAAPRWQLSSTNFIVGQRPFNSPVVGPNGVIYVQAGNRIAAIAGGGGYTDAQWPNRRGDGTASSQAPRLIRPPAAPAVTSPVAGVNVVLSTEVAFAVGTPVSVEFWSGQQLLGVTTNLTGGVTWTNLPPGGSSVRVEVVDQAGTRHLSRPTVFNVGGPRLTAATESARLTLSFASHANFAYTVLSSTNLVAWQTNVPAINGTGEALVWTDSAGGSPRFYRLQCRPRQP